jgi:hypothetical protein
MAERVPGVTSSFCFNGRFAFIYIWGFCNRLCLGKGDRFLKFIFWKSSIIGRWQSLMCHLKEKMTKTCNKKNLVRHQESKTAHMLLTWEPQPSLIFHIISISGLKKKS